LAFKRSQKIHDSDSLYEYAVGALARRMRTVAELKRLLRQKKIVGDPDAVIQKIIERLKEQKYLNDTQYATHYSSLRRDSKFGKQRVITDLKARGVHADIIAKTVSSTYEGTNEEELARDFLRKKRIQPPAKPRRDDLQARKRFDKETARIFRTLVRAGFRTGTIMKVLRTFGAEDEVLTELEAEGASWDGAENN
jgi:regulatory protein